MLMPTVCGVPHLRYQRVWFSPPRPSWSATVSPHLMSPPPSLKKRMLAGCLSHSEKSQSTCPGFATRMRQALRLLLCRTHLLSFVIFVVGLPFPSTQLCTCH